MALHTELPIHRTGVRLLDQAIKVAAVQLVELAYPEGRAKLRIATADAWQTALVYWDGKTGWRPA